MSDTEYRAFVRSVIDNVKKNGFPEKRVSFSLEKMYELAEKKGFNFNKVLETLDDIQIAHEKTPEKIIFYPKKAHSENENTPDPEPAPTPGSNPMDALKDIDLGNLKNMNPSDMMATAAQVMQGLSPEQLESMKEMYTNMSDEERAELMEQAKKMGML